MDEIIYETTFENKRSEWVHICDNGTKKLADLAPGQKLTVQAVDPSRTYARFSRVVFEHDGGVTLTDNKEWKHPDPLPTQFVTEVVNEAGHDHERIECNGQWFSCYRGIPRYLYPDITCRTLILYSEIRFVKKLFKKPDPINPNYLMQDFKIDIEKKYRPKKDLERIKAMYEERKMGGSEFLRQLDEAIQNAQ